MLRILLVVAAAAVVCACSGSSSSCDPSTCTTCCDSSGKCALGNTEAACGTGGTTCDVCGSGQSCVQGFCSNSGAGGGTSANGGGTGNAGGGSSSSGGGSGSLGGGAGSTGGGTAAGGPNSLFPDTGPGSTNAKEPDVAVDGNGVIHAVYDGFSGTGGGNYPIRYGECASSCALASSWRFTTIANQGGLGGYPRLGLDGNGHPRVIYEYQLAGTNTTPEWHYAQCNSNCTTGASWTDSTAYTFAMGGTTYVVGRHDFAVDSAGHPHFIFASYESFMNLTTYLTCDSACLAGTGPWKALLLDPNNEKTAGVAATSSGGVRAIFTNSSPAILSYRQCDSACGDSINNWTAEQPLFLSFSGDVRLRVDSQGRMRMAWYQGNSGNPMGMATDNLLLYGWCNGSCTTASNWSAQAVGLGATEGKDGFDLVVDATDKPGISFRSDMSDFGVVLCTSGCNSSSAVWQVVPHLETSDSVAADVPAPLPLSCSGVSQAFWYPGYNSAAALYGTGAVIVHETRSLQQCNGNTPVDGPQLMRVYLVQ